MNPRAGWHGGWSGPTFAGRRSRKAAFEDFCRAAVEELEGRRLLSVFTVTTVADASGGSLRQAILDANANAGTDTIQFEIPGTGVHTIVPGSALPAITGPVVFDVSQEPGYAGKPLIELDGASAGSATDGLTVIAGGTTVSGFIINRFGRFGLRLTGKGGDLVKGNYFGTNADGTAALPNGDSGIDVEGVSNDTIGGTTAADANVLSGNAHVGIFITGTLATGNVVEGNLIGTDAAGSSAVPNHFPGVEIANGANGNVIGGSDNGTRNVISGNASDGVYVENSGTTANRIQGNYIGINAAGTEPLPNALQGVQIGAGATGNTVGGATPGTLNVISGNTQSGVFITDSTTTGNIIEGNYIGTNPAGSGSIPNSYPGIAVGNGANGNTIGGTTPGTANVVSGNNSNGIRLYGTGTDLNVVEGNLAGLDAAGTAALPNALPGISVDGGAQNNTIGGASVGARNVVSGNTDVGVFITGESTNGNIVEGNFIGTDANGISAIGNKNPGVEIANGAGQNTIGGTAAADRNVISGGHDDGVFITDLGTTGNVVEGNYIGTTAAGDAALPNSNPGVGIQHGAQGNIIGGTTNGAGNLISGNSDDGIYIADTGTSQNVVQGNLIGTNPAGTRSIANTIGGVSIENGATGNTIGGTTPGARNIISGNGEDGVFLSDPGTTGNTVEGNYVGTTAGGTAPLPNNDYPGIGIQHGAQGNTIGGTANGAGNLISGNNSDGVYIADPGTSENVVEGNFIGTNPAATGSIANANGGVSIENGATGNTIGGTAPGARNIISGNGEDGVFLTDPGTTGNSAQGNFIGTDAAGTVALPNGYSGVTIANGAHDNQLGGTAAGAGNLISGNSEYGVFITDPSTNGNIVQGNYVGTAAGGNAKLANALSGIYVEAESANNLIGGTAAGDGNVISGNGEEGILIDLGGGNQIQGNFIGIGADGKTPVGNHLDGIDLETTTGNAVGGSDAGAGNFIAYNSLGGVVLEDDPGPPAVFSFHNTVLRNSIFSNGALGIDLGDDGLTLNDSHGHAGANNFQNFPVLTTANTNISGTLSSTPNSTFRVELFSNTTADPSGYGQGQIYLGFVNVLTDNSGNGSFSFNPPSALTPGQFVTATATDPQGDTSEFSKELVATRLVMFTGNGDGTSWTDPKNWSTGQLPGPLDDAMISLADHRAVTLGSGAQTVHSLVTADPLTISGGSLAVATTAQFSADLTLAGGTLLGGTYQSGGGASLVVGGQPATLDGVTVVGNILVGDFALTVRHGLTLNGTLTIAGTAGHRDNVLFNGTQTLSGTGSVVFGGTAIADVLQAQSDGTGPATLTIGPGITVHGKAGVMAVGYVTGFDVGDDDAVVNQGTINADVAGLTIKIGSELPTYQASINNQGTIEATTTNATVVIQTANFTNTGTTQGINGGTLSINPGPGATLTFGAGTTIVTGTLDNTGSLTVAPNATVVLSGQQTFETTSSVTGAGTIRFEGIGKSTVAGTFAPNALVIGNSITGDSPAVVLNTSVTVSTLTVNDGTLTVGALAAAPARLAQVVLPNSVVVKQLLTMNGGEIQQAGPAQVLEVDGNGLTFAGGGGTIQLASDDNTPGVLRLGGDVAFMGTGSGSIFSASGGTQPGQIDLANATRTFDVTADASALFISAQIVNGGLTKSGAGLMELSAANTYAGGTQVVGGTLQADNPGALGTGAVSSPGGMIRFGNGSSTLTLGSPLVAAPGDSINLSLSSGEQLTIPGLTLGKALNVTGTGGTLIVSKPVVLQGDVTINNSADVVFQQQVSGTGTIEKTLGGTLTLEGDTDNRFAGKVVVDAGTLRLAKTGGAVAVPHDLRINGGGTVTLAGPGQLDSAADVLINPVGAPALLDLGGFAQTIASLDIQTVQKNAVQLGGGTLTIRYGSAADPYDKIETYVSTRQIVTSASSPAPAPTDGPGAVSVGAAAAPPIPGDANGDGKVDFADLLILAQNYRKTGGVTFGTGDFNSDGAINFADLLILAQNYGRSRRR